MKCSNTVKPYDDLGNTEELNMALKGSIRDNFLVPCEDFVDFENLTICDSENLDCEENIALLEVKSISIKEVK